MKKTARKTDGAEIQLQSWTTFGVEDPLDARAVNQMLVGVTTRRYARLEPLAAALPERGTSKSAVSRRFVAATQKQMDAWLGRDLSQLKLVDRDGRRRRGSTLSSHHWRA